MGQKVSLLLFLPFFLLLLLLLPLPLLFVGLLLKFHVVDGVIPAGNFQGT
jgi:hypothetical protein